MGNLTDIDRLIEQGLTLYGQGDLDKALLSWEQALLIDPGNEQANSYVDYVRQNYELLTRDVSQEEHDPRTAPFGIADDEPEYQIEILPGEELEPSDAATLDPLDQAWFIEDENSVHRARTRSGDLPQVSIEIEADEPPPVNAAPVAPPRQVTEPPPISFDDETREYPGGPPKPPQPTKRAVSELPAFADTPDPVTTEFRPEGTPGFDVNTPPGGFTQVTPGFDTPTSGFGTQVTDIRERNTGFVQPTAAPPAKAPRPKRASQVPPELKMTLRTPGEGSASIASPGFAGARSTPEGSAESIEPAASSSAVIEQVEIEIPPPGAGGDLGYDEPPTTERPPVLDPEAQALIDSLPNPTPVATLKTSTRDLPPPSRTPAPPTGEHTAAGTRDFPPQPSTKPTSDFSPQAVKTEKLPSGARFDLPDSPEKAMTRDVPTSKLPNFGRELISAPTRDLGMRAAAIVAGGDPAPPPPNDDEPTTLRKPRMAGLGEGTQADVILPFDPIDARSAQILDEIDVDVPAGETKEDRTRRRITRLFEHAVEWSKAGELERAVTAIDLALSEDPNSALAQKLIHRNRDTMMTVFQTFLGDLQRQPMLARPLHELAAAPISPRAAFLLSRVDGTLSLDEILDVSGMPRLEAYRYLCQLFLRGILR